MPSRMFLAVIFLGVMSAAALSSPIVPKEFSDAVQPQIAIAPSGEVHVVFGRNETIYHTASKDGRAFSAPVEIGRLEKLALRMRRGPRVAVSGENVTVSAISHATGQLHQWFSRNRGSTWESRGALNTVPKSAREGLHAMAADGNGLLALTWLDLRSGAMELWSRTSRDGGENWGPEVRIYASPDGHICECCHPSVAIGPKGEIAAMWRNWLDGSRDMWTAVSTDGGKTFPEPRKLGQGSWPLKGCPMDGGGIAFDPDGKLISVWRREATVYSAGLADPENQLCTIAAQPVVAQTSSGLAMAFENNGQIMLTVNGELPKPIGTGKAPALASNASGACYIAWESANGGMEIERVP